MADRTHSPIEIARRRTRSARRDLAAALGLFVVAGLLLAWAASADSTLVLLYAVGPIAVAHCLFLYVVTTRCPSCGNLFFQRFPIKPESRGLPARVTLLQKNPSCAHCGFQP